MRMGSTMVLRMMMKRHSSCHQQKTKAPLGATKGNKSHDQQQNLQIIYILLNYMLTQLS